MSAARIPSPLAAFKREVEIWAGLLFAGVGSNMLVIATKLAPTELRYAGEAIAVSATVLQKDFISANRVRTMGRVLKWKRLIIQAPTLARWWRK